jgi:hypothetical protein
MVFLQVGGDMKKIVIATLMALVVFPVFAIFVTAQQIDRKDCFFLSSLHYSAAGMAYWYSKDRGGLELLTGVPYSQLGCKNCHVQGCDRCHRVEIRQKDCQVYEYTTAASRNQSLCLECHGREKAMIGINHKQKQEDVHLLSGMGCIDCHSAREMHGDGNEYVSLKQEGAMETRCEDCHDDVTPTESHTVHQDKLDCKACHIRHVLACTNCHFDTMVKTGQRKAIPASGWMFLMNYRDKVTSASTQTFVVEGKKTFLMFAPHMSHAITKEGRSCDSCHGTDIMKQAVKGKLRMTWIEKGKVDNLKGVIPVVDRVDYKFIYQDFVDGKWVPIKDPSPPVRQYVAFGQPLTDEQLKHLVEIQEVPQPQMK